jgi:GDP-4-dehydro-6-deoxy-D-mannose reductase
VTRRYLVTGAQGFLGRYLVARLLRDEAECEVLGIGRSPRDDAHFTHALAWSGAPLPAPLPAELRPAARDPRYDYRPADVADALAHAVADFRPHAVFHLASGLRGDPRDALYRTALGGTRGLLAWIAAAGVPVERIVLGSSGAVYRAGPGCAPPFAEDAPLRPADAYGRSKLAAERACRAFPHLPVVRARIFNLVGPGQDERHAAGRFAGRLAAMAGAGAPRRLEVGSLAPTRDWMDVRDAASALALLARRGEPGRAYNVATGVEVPVREVLDALVRRSGMAVGVREDRAGPPPGEPRHVADVGRLRALGFAPAYALRDTLAELWDYYTGVVFDGVSSAA